MIRRACAVVFYLIPAALTAETRSAFGILDRNDSPRVQALGGGVTGFAEDAGGGLRNPAIWGKLRTGEVQFGYAGMPDGIADGQVSGSFPVKWGTIGGAALTRRFGDIDGFDGSANRTTPFTASEQAFVLGSGREISPRLWAGAALKSAGVSIAGRGARANALDLGLLKKWGPSWALGATLRNLGSGGAFVAEKSDLPRAWTVGTSRRFRGGAWNLLGELEGPAGGEIKTRLGVEAWFMGSLSLRAGWKSGLASQAGYSLGMGLRQKSLSIDYALNLSDGAFGPRHRLGLSWRFGRAAERLYEEGLSLQRAGRNAEAVLKFKETLDADPEHPDAVTALREAVKSLSTERGPAPQ